MQNRCNNVALKLMLEFLKKHIMLRTIISIGIILLLNSCGGTKKSKQHSNSLDSTQVSNNKTSDFLFLGEKVGRKENFDTNIVVTKENIARLYSNYKITQLQDSNYFKIESKKIYEGARYLTRLIKFIGNTQSKAVNFYDFKISNIEFKEKDLIIGLNSLSYSSINYPSCFCCKIIILNRDLNKTFERKFQYSDYEYTYFDTLYLTKFGFNAEIINIGFDSDDYFRYSANFDSNGKIISSKKRKELIQK